MNNSVQSDCNNYSETEHDINVTVIDREGKPHVLEVPADMNLSLMELCKASDLPVLGTCGGIALCASCHVYIESETTLIEPSEDEDIMLDQVAYYKSNSRLGCQIRLDESCDGLVVRLAQE